MSSKDFKKALREKEATESRAKTILNQPMTDEEIRETAFRSRRNRDANIPQKMADDSTRNDLLRQTGFDWIDVEELHPHPENTYHFDEHDIENLAGLIYNSKETQPLVARETEDGLQIIDGERRWHAHKLLSKLYGDLWRMVPVRIHPLGALTDQEVKFILHSNNAGQRRQTPSERAMGFAFVADTIMKWRSDNPSLKGTTTKAKLAEHFGVSERTAQKNLTIGKGLTPRCCEMLDNKKLTLDQAESIATLSEQNQNAIADKIEELELSTEDVNLLITKVKSGKNVDEEVIKRPKTQKDTNAYLKTAKNALKKAAKDPSPASYKLLGEVKELIRDLERIQNELENNQH